MKETEAEWYWEAGHFKSQLANMVLKQVLSSVRCGTNDESFGYSVTPATLHENRNRIAHERKSCAASYPEIFLQAQQHIANTTGIESTGKAGARPSIPVKLFANTVWLSSNAT